MEDPTPTISMARGISFLLAVDAASSMAFILSLVIFPRFTLRDDDILVISLTSSGWAAHIAFAPKKRIEFASIFMAIGFVMAWISGLLSFNFSLAFRICFRFFIDIYSQVFLNFI